MLPGTDRLRRARGILDQNGRKTPEPLRLIEAASECWSAIIDSAVWPVELRMEATMLQGSMFRYGSIEATVERMTEGERNLLRRDIVNLATAVERISDCPH